MSVRKAQPRDISQISKLLEKFSGKKVLLPRTRKEIIADLENTWVFESNEELLGTACLIYFSEQLCEIRALAVAKEAQGRGVGRQLVSEIQSHLSSRGPVRLFALTYEPDFFEKMGFRVTSKERFPQKIYEVCQFCSRREDCGEIAVEYSYE